MKVIRICIIAAITTAILAISVKIFGKDYIGADFGNFAGSSDYNYGSDYDYDSSYSGSYQDSYSYDSGSNDWGSSQYNYNNYSNNYYYRNNRHNTTDNSINEVQLTDEEYEELVEEWTSFFNNIIDMVLLVFIGIPIIGVVACVIADLIIYLLEEREVKKNIITQKSNSTNTNGTEKHTMVFIESEFKKELSKRYIEMQHAWSARDISSIKSWFSEDIYNQMSTLLKQMVDSHKTNYVEDIEVIDISVLSSEQYSIRGRDIERVVAVIKAKIKDYTVDDITNEVVSGSKHNHKIMTYEYTLRRSNSYDWVITNIKGISQKTVE